MLLAPAPAAVVRYELGYSGVPLFGTHERPVALDTETDLAGKLDPAAVNNLALVQASDGGRTVLVHPADLARFLDDHEGVPFVGHNLAAFDFWVLARELERQGRAAHVGRLWARAAAGLLHDTQILDSLVRLAEGKGETGGEDKFYPRNLGEVAREYAGIVLDKEDPYRMRYAEIIGKKFSEVRDKGFWEYAARDAYGTAHAWPPLYRKALALATRFAAGVGPDGPGRLARWLGYGVLTEQVQVRGAIALAQIERTGMPFCPDAARADEARWRPAVEACVAAIDALRPGFFKKKNGRFEYAARSRVPKTNQADLTAALGEAALKIKAAIPDFTPPQSDGKAFREHGEAISRSADDWAPYVSYDPFLGHWVRLAACTKRLGYYPNFAAPPRDLFSDLGAAPDHRIRARYSLLMRTGRTSSSRPNQQNYPRDKDFRGIFRVGPGTRLLTIDLAAIELSTLAATCHERFGFSVLGDVIRAGKDPHAITAAMVRGMAYEDFLGLKASDPESFKRDRQKAKACFSGDTELLTPDGWERIDVLYLRWYETGCQPAVAQYCPHTGEIDLVEPLAWVHNRASDLIEIDATYMNQMVTPDHRCLLISKMTGGVREVLAGDLARVMEECWLTVHGGRLRGGNVGVGELKTRLSVMVQADGHFTEYDVRLGFSKKRKVDRCRDLLTRAGLAFTERAAVQAGKKVTTFTVTKGDWYALTDDKHFLGWPTYDHATFVEEVGLWDGCEKLKHAASYSNTSYADVLCAQTILVLSGYKTNLAVSPARGNHKAVYTLYWYVGDWKKNPEYARCNRDQTTYTRTQGPSYCVSVPTSWVLTRRKGKVTVSGNCNFGVPGGLNSFNLALYATASYGVAMSVEEAVALRNKLIYEVYPELSDKNGYLADDTLQAMALNLGLSLAEVRAGLPAGGKDWVPRVLAGVLRGKTNKATGEPYDARFLAECWAYLRDLGRKAPRDGPLSPLAREKLLAGSGDPLLANELTLSHAVTLTGRVRGRVRYTQARNTPFQGLAADGAKMALFALTRAGFRVCGFVHDEVVVELPAAGAGDRAAEVERILCAEMAGVLGGDLPVRAEWTISDRWTK